jgi:poly-gamma-glutamate synthesis protein (capsule biosynthesis protein)
MLVGDLILDEPHPDRYFDLSRGTLKNADLAIGHVEVPHTKRGIESSTDVPAPPASPAHLRAVRKAGFHVATLAGNHIFDAGPNGITDTIRALDSSGVHTTGAGRTLAEARRPAIVERSNLRVGVLSYNCAGPALSWASPKKAGCAFVKILTHYELDHATPGGPPSIYTFADPTTLASMEADIVELKRKVNVVVVALHKGVGHTPAVLAMYERPVSKAAIDAGADIVVGHHAHILRGIEIYRGKPIYHGLGNFVTVTHALSPRNNSSPERLAWAKRRKKLFGFEPDPNTPEYPFHPQSRNTMIAVCDVNEQGVARAGFIPCWINQSSQPHPLDRKRGGRVTRYIRGITEQAGLSTTFRWQDDVVWCE